MLVATAAAADVRRLPVPMVVKLDIKEAATAVVVVLDGKQIRHSPIKSSKSNLQRTVSAAFASVQTDTSARPGTLLRWATGRTFWKARTRGRSRFIS
jgi:hypothetical protein